MYIRRSDRRALVVLFFIIVALMTGVLMERWLHPREELPSLDDVHIDTLSLTAPETTQHTSATQHAIYVGTDDIGIQPETFPFDPNTADSTTLLRLGLAPWQVRSMLRYRSRGGRYHRVEDFKRVPGMTPEVYERLAPVIHIARQFRYYEDINDTLDATRSIVQRHSSDSMHQHRRDSLKALGRPEKFREMMVLDLNSVDTLTLQRIPGIGSVRAQKIVQFRERMGGFVSVSQLSEIQAVPNELAEWFHVDTDKVKKLNVNTMSVRQLAHHPYMGFTRAKAIDDYRKLHGHIADITALSLLPEFSEDALNRLQPYLEY